MFLSTLITGLLLISSVDAKSSYWLHPADGSDKSSFVINETPVYAPFIYSKDTTVFNTEIDTSFYRINTTYRAALVRLKNQAVAIKEYVAANNYNTEYCFLVDMSVPDGKNRFFVYNLEKDSLEKSSLVSHGFGSTKPGSYDELVFSNEPNSFMTSLGHYKIGAAYRGTYGYSYKLSGLDNSNDKAYERTIVLHADAHVPEKEPFPYHI